MAPFELDRDEAAAQPLFSTDLTPQLPHETAAKRGQAWRDPDDVGSTSRGFRPKPSYLILVTWTQSTPFFGPMGVGPSDL